ncbi:MAG: DUF167 domain-containing protein [Candidatus Sumerlaeota bacterium]
MKLKTEPIRQIEGGVELQVHLQPNASKSEFVGLHGDSIKARVQAKPVEGQANKAAVRLIASTAEVSKSSVELIRGASSRTKVFRIACDSPAKVVKKLRKKCKLA